MIDHDDGKKSVGHGAGIADVEEAQARAEGEHRVGLGRDAGAAAGESEGDVEQLDGFRQPDQQHDDDGGREQRQQHLGEQRQAAGTVDARGLQELVRHALQGGEEDQEAERRPLPDVDQGHGEKRPVRVREPGDSGPAQRPAGLVEDGEEDVAGGQRRGEDRQDHDRTEHAAAHDLLVEEQGQEEAERQLQGHREEHEDEADLDRLAHLRVGD